ncbi:hypothetical protein L484_012696 [Morus notabilis]|uniref:Uncharacterized protein n=1 Tax=Morus notabilis TaxID=981085 RepID=W9RTA0_9ROSA|nr:hypothetical protein L484_012696 [Morus notabilis]
MVNGPVPLRVVSIPDNAYGVWICLGLCLSFYRICCSNYDNPSSSFTSPLGTSRFLSHSVGVCQPLEQFQHYGKPAFTPIPYLRDPLYSRTLILPSAGPLFNLHAKATKPPRKGDAHFDPITLTLALSRPE